MDIKQDKMTVPLSFITEEPFPLVCVIPIFFSYIFPFLAVLLADETL